MGKNVFANGREIAAKKSDNKCLAAMPNVCLSPPSPPAGPIPIPYPCFGSTSDTDKGSKKTKIGGQPIMLKNKSEWKKSEGDKAATKSFGQGLTVGGLGGGIKFVAWSCDVKVEGKNVCRLGDMLSGNHGSPMSNSVDSGVSTGGATPPPTEEDCKELDKANKKNQKNDTKSGELESGQTMTTAKINGEIKKASTPMSKIKWKAKAGKKGKGNYLKGQFVKGGTESPNVACSDKPYPADKRGRSSCNHTEGKIIEAAHKAGAKQITMSIDWISKGRKRNHPCEACDKSLCIAIKDCEMEIYICKDGKPEPHECD